MGAKYRCSDHPELQAKIRTAMIEGKIADEDFNGDPEYNMLGQAGIRGRSSGKVGEDQVLSLPSTPARNQLLISLEW